MIQAQEQKLLDAMEKYHKEAEKHNDDLHVEAKQWAQGLETHLKDLKMTGISSRGVSEEAKEETRN